MTREEATKELAEWIKQMENHGVPPYSAKYKALKLAIEALQAEPTIVRCKDCKHRHEYRNGEYIDCDCTDFYDMDDNDYCCFGERRSDDK